MSEAVIYLNHAGTSWPKPAVVTSAVQSAMVAVPSDWPHLFHDAHQAVSAYFGVQRPEQLLLTPGCTSSLSIAIADARIAAGKRILTSQWEHHALMRPLLKLAATGVATEIIPVVKNSHSSGLVDLDWLERELSKGDVALVAVTAACNVTGDLLPYQQVIELAHANRCPVLLDAAQVVGWHRLDFTALAADMIAFGGHKGLQTTWGIGGLYIADTMQMQCVDASCVIPSAAAQGSIGPRPGYCDVGSVDQFALAGLHASVNLLAAKDEQSYFETAKAQIQRIRNVLETLPSVRVYGHQDISMPTVAFSIAGQSSGQVARQLAKQGVIVGYGLQCAPSAHAALGTEQEGLVRISVGIQQDDNEIVQAMRRIEQNFSA